MGEKAVISAYFTVYLLTWYPSTSLSFLSVLKGSVIAPTKEVWPEDRITMMASISMWLHEDQKHDTGNYTCGDKYSTD